MKRLEILSGVSVLSVFLALSLMGAGPGGIKIGIAGESATESAGAGESTAESAGTEEGVAESAGAEESVVKSAGAEESVARSAGAEESVARSAGAGVLTYEGPIFKGSGEAHRPQLEIEKDGRKYRLVSSELLKALKTGRSKFVSAQISFFLEGDFQPPDMAEILVTDEDTGQSLEYTVPRMEVTEAGAEWMDDFSFPVTVSNYGADAFLLGDLEIPGGAPLSQFGPELLNYLNLSTDCYQVEQVEWNGEPYEKEGKSFRDAEAKGKKLVRSVKVRYGGQVELPPVEGLKYQALYKEIIEDGEAEAADTEEKVETAEAGGGEAGHGADSSTEEAEQEERLLEKLGRWLMEHLTVVRLGAGFLVGILFAAILLILSARREKKKKPGGSA